MCYKKISIHSFLLAIIYALSIIILAAVFGFLFSKENVKKNKIPEIKHCSREEYSPKEEIKNWKTYFNDEHCFSIQYPDNWKILESLEHVGPYIVFGKGKLDDSETYPKIFINFYNMQMLALSEQTFLYNADTSYLWQGSDPAYRIWGNIEDSKNAKEAIPYTYSDSIIIPRERCNDYSDYLVISYNEKDFSKEDREIFEKMYESFNIAEN
ncbi:MAG: hypothetical protein V1651_01190 [Patescibacteria group bacterium]